MSIERGSPIPVYVQLADLLRAQISAGRYPQGAALPPEDGIGRLHGVGRMSVRRAIAVLHSTLSSTTPTGGSSWPSRTPTKDLLIFR
ncbi:GntR family transcriptional regulator [Dactylosporangium salmoneum]|uniref:HTH gntR-type domain-containing protein n=1 Tax=Dactylosporangium salmoneum TaxID=53361 RepID=A0ABN3GKM7_9ACTN